MVRPRTREPRFGRGTVYYQEAGLDHDPVKKSETPRIFRWLLPATDLVRSQAFYESRFHRRGRRVGGGRVYFDCGAVILGIVDYSAAAPNERSTPTEPVYFATGDLEAVHRRARSLKCLAPGLLHNDPANPAGEIVQRPWGERSFYATDPSGNPLCFVDAETLFTGTPAQASALAGRGTRRPAPRSPARRPRTKPRARARPSR